MEAEGGSLYAKYPRVEHAGEGLLLKDAARPYAKTAFSGQMEDLSTSIAGGMYRVAYDVIALASP